MDLRIYLFVSRSRHLGLFEHIGNTAESSGHVHHFTRWTMLNIDYFGIIPHFCAKPLPSFIASIPVFCACHEIPPKSSKSPTFLSRLSRFSKSMARDGISLSGTTLAFGGASRCSCQAEPLEPESEPGRNAGGMMWDAVGFTISEWTKMKLMKSVFLLKWAVPQNSSVNSGTWGV